MEAFSNSSTNSSYACKTSYSGKIHLLQSQKDVLISLMAVTMILNISANSGVMYALITTKQLNNLSMHLIFFLCVSDSCLAGFGQPLFIVMLANYSNSYYCNFDTIVEFFVYLFCHISAYLIGLIGYDRFFRMKYLNRYSEVVKAWKLHVAMVITVFLSLVQTSTQVIGVKLHIYRKVKMAGIFVDFIKLLLMIFPYILTMRVVKHHMRNAVNRRMLSKVDKTITSIASRIMVSITILYTPYVMFDVLHIFLDEKTISERFPWIHLSMFIGYQLGIANSFVNAIIFVSFNKKSQRKLFYFCKSNVKRDEDTIALTARVPTSVSDTLVIHDENRQF